MKNQTKTRDFVIVVSGLPRSGTSLMMQILAANGLPLLVDNQRKADESNPQGYFEYQPVKTLKQNAQWLHLAKGKAVKIISNLLFYLPKDWHYKVIFLQRDLDEIITSQQRMLANLNKQAPLKDPTELKALLAAHLLQVQQWLAQQPNINVFKIPFTDLIFQPEKVLPQLQKFLQWPIDLQQSKRVIRPDLYRSRKSE